MLTGKRLAQQAIQLVATVAITAAPETFARPVQLVIQPSVDQAASMTHGLQFVVSQEQHSEVRMMTPEPVENGRMQLAFLFINRSDKAINIGPENVVATQLSLVTYDMLLEEQRRREGRRKFGNFLFKLGNALSAADAGNQYGSFSYSGTSSQGAFVHGSGTFSNYNPYLARQAQTQAAVENREHTERMYQTFSVMRSAINANLRTTTIMPYQQIQGILTFDVPRPLQKAAVSQQFMLSIQIGTDRHELNGFVGPIGTLPTIAPSRMITPTERVEKSAMLTDANVPADAPQTNARALPPTPRQTATRTIQSAAQVAPTGRPVQNNTISIAGYRRGDYIGQPDKIAALAQQGFAPAQNEMGTLYQLGKFVSQDNAIAMRFYRLAAAQGFREAQSNLAWMYENGQGSPRNIAAAKRYYGLAADQGDELASSRLIALQTGR